MLINHFKEENRERCVVESFQVCLRWSFTVPVLRRNTHFLLKNNDTLLIKTTYSGTASIFQFTMKRCVDDIFKTTVNLLSSTQIYTESEYSIDRPS